MKLDVKFSIPSCIPFLTNYTRAQTPQIWEGMLHSMTYPFSSQFSSYKICINHFFFSKFSLHPPWFLSNFIPFHSIAFSLTKYNIRVCGCSVIRVLFAFLGHWKTILLDSTGTDTLKIILYWTGIQKLLYLFDRFGFLFVITLGIWVNETADRETF